MAPHVFVEECTVVSAEGIRTVYESGELREKLTRHHNDPDGAFYGWNATWLMPEFRDWNIEAELPGIHCPVTVIQGEDDEYGTLQQVQALTQGIGTEAEVVLLPDCRHLLYRDKEDEVLTAIERHVRRVLDRAVGTPIERNTESVVSRCALVVLAAGRSTRMGSPKALVELDGRPLLEHLLAPRLLRDFGDVVVVLGHHAEALLPVVERSGYRHVVNPDPDRGRTGSVQTGLNAVRPGMRAIFIQPVDCPIILPATYLALAEAVSSFDVVIPSCDGKHGHPPLVSAELFPRIMAAGPDAPLRDVLRGAGVGRRYVEVDDPGVLVNVDRPEDLKELAELYAAR
jgi:CTP:molybdopterin cytidylyltransferase MocA